MEAALTIMAAGIIFFGGLGKSGYNGHVPTVNLAAPVLYDYAEAFPSSRSAPASAVLPLFDFLCYT